MNRQLGKCLICRIRKSPNNWIYSTKKLEIKIGRSKKIQGLCPITVWKEVFLMSANSLRLINLQLWLIKIKRILLNNSSIILIRSLVILPDPIERVFLRKLKTWLDKLKMKFLRILVHWLWTPQNWWIMASLTNLLEILISNITPNRWRKRKRKLKPKGSHLISRNSSRSRKENSLSKSTDKICKKRKNSWGSTTTCPN